VRGRELTAAVLASVKLCLGDAATWEDIRALVGDVAAQRAYALAQKLYNERMISNHPATVTNEVSPIMEGTGKDA
jgi:hypothetical protein